MNAQTMILESGDTLLAVHFIYPGQKRMAEVAPAVWRRMNHWIMACVPNMEQFETTADRQEVRARSDDPRAVTCPLCKDTDEYKAKLVEVMNSIGKVCR